ncbi:hypothetical protein DAI22_02g249500 [Oryza sativa Japonica Group]|uniref:Uncharacterized protein n=2 Tax=Oryza TaxID=4527 RepID=A0A0D3F7P5_9ORYZ|nr:transcription factor MYB57-like [Oryza glaberrima]KAF2945882.1 hypothetical protein DAI22_02g249500 [Oryza sativa Japonica Group]
MEGQQFAWGREEGGWRKGPWTAQEDKLLVEYVRQHGEGRWNSVAKITGLKRSGKSCRLRWVNYLRPDLKRGKITPQEESVILELHALWGNRWSTIARSLPGRTDNEIKNYWRTHFKKGKPSKNIERARARFLKQRREMQQQSQLMQTGQQQQLGQDDDATSAVVDDNLAEVAPPAATSLTHDGELQIMQEMAPDMDDLLYYHPGDMSPYSYDDLLGSGGGECGAVAASAGAAASTSEGSSEELDGGAATWGSLWNLDDVVHDMMIDCAAGAGCCWGSFPPLQDQGLAFY